MRKFIFLLLVLLPFVASAQMERSIVIDESSFASVQTDVMSGVPIDKIGKDRSNRECARIKMRINRMTAAEIDELSVRPFGGNVEIMKCVVATEGNGLIIEMTAKQPTRFYITHPKYGDSNEVSFNLSGGKEYRVDAELRLQHTIVVASNFANVEVYVDGIYKGVTDSNYMLSVSDVTPGEHKIKVQQGSLVSEQTVNVSSADISFRINLDHVAARPQYVIFEVEPKWANVVVDGKSYVPDQYGLVTIVLSNGIYNYSVSANDYYSTNGTLQVQGAKVEKRIALKPAFGWLSVPDRSDLNGANVFVDGTHIGTAPLKSAGIKSGEHKVRIMKTMYKVCEQTIVIKDSETLTFAPKLESDFADVTINAGEGCQIYVDNEFKGTTTWSGRLTSGSHMLESRKDNHRSTSVAKSVVPGSSRLVFTLADPTPIMGTLNVISTPGMADVYVDGVLVGRTPLMHDVLVGNREVVIRKQGFGDYKQSVRVEEGNVVDVVATMAEYKEKTYVETVKGINSNDQKIEFVAILDDTEDFSLDDIVIEEKEEKIVEEEIFFTVEEMPKFRGGGLPEFRNWVQQNVMYPQIALENGIQGNVVVQFVVGPDGKMTNFKVLQSPDKTLADATIEVMKKANEMKNGWKPGKQRGKPVKVSFTLPVAFTIQD